MLASVPGHRRWTAVKYPRIASWKHSVLVFASAGASGTDFELGWGGHGKLLVFGAKECRFV